MLIAYFFIEYAIARGLLRQFAKATKGRRGALDYAFANSSLMNSAENTLPRMR